MVRNDGITFDMVSQSRKRAKPKRCAPTTMRMAPEIKVGTASTIGENGKTKRKRKEATIEVRPVLPCARIPANDSAKTMTEGDPKREVEG